MNAFTRKPEFTSQLEDLAVLVGEEISLVAEVSAKPEASVTWFKNHKELKESDRIKFTHTDNNKYGLLIGGSTTDDSGSYKVIQLLLLIRLFLY